MANPGKPESLAKELDAAAQEAERLGLTTATLILRMIRLEIDRTELDKVETMPRNNLHSKPNQTVETVRFWLSGTVSREDDAGTVRQDLANVFAILSSPAVANQPVLSVFPKTPASVNAASRRSS